MQLPVEGEGGVGGLVASLNPGSPRVSRGCEPTCLNQNQDNLSHSSLLLPILRTQRHQPIVPGLLL